MKYDVFKSMMAWIRREAAEMAESGEPKVEIIDWIYDNTMYNYFWDYETDRPSCDWRQLEKLIENTVRRLLPA